MIALGAIFLGCAGPWGTVRVPERPAADTAAAVASAVTGATGDTGAALPPNVLLVVLDDVGTDKIAAYGEGPTAPPTPTISALAAEGVLFRNAWAAPVCGPSRAMLLTGRWSRRYGFGGNLAVTDDFRIPARERMLPWLLAQAPVPYTSAGAGKWHVTGPWEQPAFMTDPLERGFARFVGTPGNVASYFAWVGAVDGALVPRSGYLTSATADDAIAAATTLPEPWFVYLAFNAPHAPQHVPPAELDPVGVRPTDPRARKYDAMLTAADLELGRVLDALDPALRERTVVLVTSDNGTPDFAIGPPFDPRRGKGTIYEGGVNVPLVVAGPVVGRPGSESAALVSVVDVAATLVELAGVDRSALTLGDGSPLVLDGASFLPQLRDPDRPGPAFAYTELLRENGPPPWELATVAARDARYKLVSVAGVQGLFDLAGRHDDGENLLAGPLDPEAAAALARLEQEIARIAEAAPYAE